MNDCAKNQAEAESFVIAKLSSCPPAFTWASLQGYQFLIQRMLQNTRMRDEGTSRRWQQKTASSNIWSSSTFKKEAGWHLFPPVSNLWIFPWLSPRAQKLPLKWCKRQICGLMGPPEEFPNQSSCPSGVGYGSLTPIWNNLTFCHYGRKAGCWKRLSLKLESCTLVSYHKMKGLKRVHPIVVACLQNVCVQAGVCESEASLVFIAYCSQPVTAR